jgi:hypothetical protein
MTDPTGEKNENLRNIYIYIYIYISINIKEERKKSHCQPLISIYVQLEIKTHKSWDLKKLIMKLESELKQY